MLFKFKSKAASDLIMLESDGRKMLKIIVGNDPLQGIVQVHELPDAIAALEAAVLLDEEERKRRTDQATALLPGEDDELVPLSAVSLAQRASPMLKLLRRCLVQHADVVWGV